MVALTHHEYEALRGYANRFAVSPGHIVAQLEVVVDSTDRYMTVKLIGAGASVCEEVRPAPSPRAFAVHYRIRTSRRTGRLDRLARVRRDAGRPRDPRLPGGGRAGGCGARRRARLLAPAGSGPLAREPARARTDPASSPRSASVCSCSRTTGAPPTTSTTSTGHSHSAQSSPPGCMRPLRGRGGCSGSPAPPCSRRRSPCEHS